MGSTCDCQPVGLTRALQLSIIIPPVRGNYLVVRGSHFHSLMLSMMQSPSPPGLRVSWQLRGGTRRSGIPACEDIFNFPS